MYQVWKGRSINMREHKVNCRIEGDMDQAKRIICQATNEMYLETVERLLEQSGWTKEMQIEFIDRMIFHVKNNLEET